MEMDNRWNGIKWDKGSSPLKNSSVIFDDKFCSSGHGTNLIFLYYYSHVLSYLTYPTASNLSCMATYLILKAPLKRLTYLLDCTCLSFSWKPWMLVPFKILRHLTFGALTSRFILSANSVFFKCVPLSTSYQQTICTFTVLTTAPVFLLNDCPLHMPKL